MKMSHLYKVTPLILVLSLLACSRNQTEVSPSISAYFEWSKSLPELPEPDNNDLLNPDYTTFQERQRPGFFARMMSKEPWTPNTFFTLLTTLTQKRSSEELIRNKVAALKAAPGTNIYIFGDLQGAFHSLLRDLNELKRRNIIGDNFKIKDPNSFFVFNGNQIDRSPYILETLSIIFLLIQENENQVIYNTGRHELNDTWRDYDALREIETLFEGDDETIEKAERSLATFFATLPVAFYVQDSAKDEKHVLKIYGHENLIASDTAGIADELDKLKVGVLTTLPIHLTKLQGDSFTVDAVIRAISRSTSFRKTDGLEMLPQEYGAIAWSSLSAPTLTYRKLFGFFNDAFINVKVNDLIRNSTITLNKQEARKQNGFDERTMHIISSHLIDSKAAPSSFTLEESPLRFGSILDLSGPSKIMGQRMRTGIDLRFRKENENTFLRGEFLRLFALDDRSLSAHWANKLSLLKGDGVSILVAPTAVAKTGSEPILFPASGAGELRDSKLKNIIHMRASIKSEMCALVRYAKDTLYARKVAFLFQNDNLGKEALESARTLLSKRYGMQDEDVCEIPYEPTSLDMTRARKKFRKCLPDTLFFVATRTASQAFIHEIGTQSLAKTRLLGISNVSDLLRSSLGSPTSSAGLTMVVSRAVPSPFDRTLQIAADYQDEMDKWYAGALYNAESFEGYLAASILLEARAKVEKPATANKIMNWLEGRKQYAYKGLVLDFNPQTRELMNSVWLDTGSQKWLEFKNANTLCQ